MGLLVNLVEIFLKTSARTTHNTDFNGMLHKHLLNLEHLEGSLHAHECVKWKRVMKQTPPAATNIRNMDQIVLLEKLLSSRALPMASILTATLTTLSKSRTDLQDLVI